MALYLIGFAVSLLIVAFLDARGCKAIDLSPRRAVSAREELTVVALLGCILWPITVSILLLTGIYFGFVRFFGRNVKKWRCPAEYEGYSYTRQCYNRETAVKAPMCPEHKVTMTEEES